MPSRAARTFWGRKDGHRHLYRKGDVVEDGPAAYLEDDEVETTRRAPGQKRTTKRASKRTTKKATTGTDGDDE